MSTLDFYAGRQAANLGNSHAMNDAKEAVSEWQGFCNRLQSKLKRAELDFVKAESGRIGFAHLFNTVVEELRRIDPTNPLLQKDNQLRLLEAKVSEKAAELGYLYDQNSGEILGKL